jgi:hypothetical protein
MYIAIVRMNIPVFDHDAAVEIGRRSADTFTALKDDGLLMKYYLSDQSGGGGGVYVWRSKEDADKWYTPAWSARLKEAYGTEPVVTFYDSFVQVDNVRNQVFVDGTPS